MKYTIPQTIKTSDVAISAPKGAMENYDARITIPVSKAMLGKLKVGKKVKVTLSGEVKRISSNEDTKKGRHEMTIMASTVEMEGGKNAFTEIADADEAGGS